MHHEIENNSYNSDGSLISVFTSKYDSKGNKIETNIFIVKSNSNFKSNYKYDDKGNEIERIDYNPDASQMGKYTSKYDSKDNMIERVEYYGDGSLSSKDTNKYDAKGNVIEYNSYDSNGSFNFKSIYKDSVFAGTTVWVYYACVVRMAYYKESDETFYFNASCMGHYKTEEIDRVKLINNVYL